MKQILITLLFIPLISLGQSNSNEPVISCDLISDFERGKEFNLSHCGMLAMDTMRMETGYLHWGHDISPEENQYQAGLEFAISYKKNIDLSLC